jgi:predicted ribosomally synthesized peptide with nif11-like leader
MIVTANHKQQIKNGGIAMSIESAKSFVERMNTDEEFAKKVTACKNAEDRMVFVKKAGFDFTADELKEVRKTLSEDDLVRVSGGDCYEYRGGNGDCLFADGDYICMDRKVGEGIYSD